MDKFINSICLTDVSNPEFEKAGRICDWRNYVPSEFKSNWDLFAEREKKIIAIMAQNEADKEEWD